MQTMSQMRSKVALDLLKEIGDSIRKVEDEKKAKKIKDDFISFSKSIPIMILQNGLGQSLAFIKAKEQSEKSKQGGNPERYTKMYDTINRWLKTVGYINNEVLTEIQKMSAQEYMKIQNETLKFLEWIKRYATAEIFE